MDEGDNIKTHDPLLAEIKRVLVKSGISRTGFGYAVCGDPTLISKMERGRQIKKPALRLAIEMKIEQLESARRSASVFD